MISKVEQIVTRFRGCFSGEAAFHRFVVVVFAMIVRVNRASLGEFAGVIGAAGLAKSYIVGCCVA